LGVPLGHELLEYLVGGQLAREEIGVLASVINLGNVVKLDKAVLVHVQFVIGGPDVCRSSLVEVTLE
jgi:hypothetical protein